MPRVQLGTKKGSTTKPETKKVATKPKAIQAPPKKIEIPPAKKSSSKPKEIKREPSHKQQTSGGLTGLSLKQLWKAAPALMRNESKELVIRSLSHKKSKLGMPAVKARVKSLSRGASVYHEVVIVGKEEGIKLSKQKHVLVSCSCEFFCFYSEYALTKWGSSQIKYCNGEPPHVTNPGLHPLMCKHCCAVTAAIMENGF